VLRTDDFVCATPGAPCPDPAQVTVTLHRFGLQIDATSTDTFGKYRFDHVEVGDGYQLRFSLAGFAPTLKDQGSSDFLDSDADPLTGFTDVFRVFTGTNDQWDVGFVAVATPTPTNTTQHCHRYANSDAHTHVHRDCDGNRDQTRRRRLRQARRHQPSRQRRRQPQRTQRRPHQRQQPRPLSRQHQLAR
jgi:hypothetical protein